MADANNHDILVANSEDGLMCRLGTKSVAQLSKLIWEMVGPVTDSGPAAAHQNRI